MKPVLSFLFLLLYTLSATASIRDGFYVGAGVARTHDQLKLNSTLLSTDFSMTNEADEGSTLGNLFIGFGNTFPTAFFLGGELGANFPSHSITINGRSALTIATVVSNTLNITDYLTFDLLPGYLIGQNLLVYGRAGIVYGSLTLKQPATPLVPGFNSSDTVCGGRFGLGTTFALDEHFGIGFDYYYTIYQQYKFTAVPNNTQFESNASSNFFGFSLLYKIW